MLLNFTIHSHNLFDNDTKRVMEYSPDMGFLVKADILVSVLPNKVSVIINGVGVREYTPFNLSKDETEDNIRFAIDKYKTIQTDKLKARMTQLWTDTELMCNRMDKLDYYMPRAMKDRYTTTLLSSLEKLNSLEMEMSLY